MKGAPFAASESRFGRAAYLVHGIIKQEGTRSCMLKADEDDWNRATSTVLSQLSMCCGPGIKIYCLHACIVPG